MIQVSKHAINRYRQRCQSSYGTKKIKAKLIEMWEFGTPAEIKKEFRAFQLASHGADNLSEYRIKDNFVLVASKGTIVTLHLNESDRFKPASHLKASKLKEKIFRLVIQFEKYHNGTYSDLQRASKKNELFQAIRGYNKAIEKE